MTLFAKHVAASRAQSRVAVNLRAESEGEIDPLNGVVADAPVETEVDAGPAAAPAGDDQFAEQRERLNRTHGMIRNRMRSEAPAEETPAVVEETPVEEVPAEIPEAPVEDVIVEEPAAEVPAEAVIEEPVIEEPIVSAEELTVEEPAAAEEVVVEEPAAAEEIPAEVAEVPAEEVPAEIDVPAEEVAPAVEAEEVVEDPVEEVPAAPAEAEVAEDVLPTPEELPAEEVVEAPVEEAAIVEDVPAVEEAAAVVEEPVVEVPAEETIIEAPAEAPVEAPVEDIVPETPAEPAEEVAAEEPALDVSQEGEFSDRPVNENIGDDVSEPDVASLPEVDGKPVVDIKDSNDVDFTSEGGEIDGDGEGDIVFSSEEEAAAAEEAEAEDAADAETVDTALEALDGEIAGIEALESEMSQLSGAAIAIESFGINPTAMAIMQTTGLLDGTALESLGLESIGFHGSREAESEMALEALTDKIKDKAAAWSAKILSVANAAGSKVMSVLEPLWNKLSGAAGALTGAVWDKAAAAGKVVKAHPYKTIAAVIASIAAVAGIVAFVGTGLPAYGVKGPAFKSFLNSLKAKIDGINFPFASIKAAVAENGAKIAVSIQSAAANAKAVAIGKLGWTQTAVKASQGQLDRVWSGVKQGSKAFGLRAGKVGKGAADIVGSGLITSMKAGDQIGAAVARNTGSEIVGAAASVLSAHAFAGAFLGVVATTINLLFRVVAAGFRIIFGTFRALKSAVA